MRLVFDTPGRFCGAGLNRYNGRGIYQNIGRKVLLSGLRTVTKKEADAIDLKKKSVGKGIDASTNTVENVDAVDSDKSVKVDEDSAMKAISNFSTETALDKDKKSIYKIYKS